jgi:hypothetical protein
MSDASNRANSLRERFGGTTEERLGKALSELLENPLLTGAIGRVFDAREKAAQAQEVAMGALNIPSAADIERLTRRLRSVSYRLEGIEDGVGRLDRALTPGGMEARLSAIEDQLQALARKIDDSGPADGATPSVPRPQARRAAPRSASASSGAAAGPAAATGGADAAARAPSARKAKRAPKGQGRKAKPAKGAKGGPKKT